VTAPSRTRRASRAYAKPRSNTPAGPATRGATPAGAGSNGTAGPSEFADDPFVRRLANPRDEERRRASIADLRHGLHVLNEQREVATEADAMYEGTVGMTFASSSVRRLLARNGVEDIPDFNYARIPVDTIANALQIAAVKVAPEDRDDDDADEGDKPGAAVTDGRTVRRAERAIKKLRKVNQLDAEEKSLHKDVSKHGDAFLFLWPVENEAGKIISVDMRVNTAHNVAFIYDTEDPLKVAYVIKSWEVQVAADDDDRATKTVVRANLYYPGTVAPDPVLDAARATGPAGTTGDVASADDEADVELDGPAAAPGAAVRRGTYGGRIERWVTRPGGPVDKPESWQRVHAPEADIDDEDIDEVAADEFGDQDDPLDRDDIASPYGLTWFHFRNDRPCGHPEHINAYGPQTLINKLIYGHAATIDYQSFPQRYLMVDPKIDDPHLNVIDPDHPEDEDDDPETETGTSGLRADPAAVWRLFGKLAGEFTAADPQTFLAPLDRYIKAMAELTDTPQHAFSKASGDMPTGEAVRGLDGPKIAKVRDRQDRYDPTWQDAYELALLMLGITGVEVDIRWVPAAPVNDLNGLQVLQAKIEMGLPPEVALNEAGYPDEQVKEWLKAAEGGSVNSRLDQLVKLGSAVQALAAGVTAGVVDEAGTSALIARMIRLIALGTDDVDEGVEGALPPPEFREPPPTNPAMAAVEAAQADPSTPLKHEQIKAQTEVTKATAETSRASARMMMSGQPAATPRKAGGKKAAPRKVSASGSTTAQTQAARG
jgi:hypothetical protein